MRGVLVTKVSDTADMADAGAAWVVTDFLAFREGLHGCGWCQTFPKTRGAGVKAPARQAAGGGYTRGLMKFPAVLEAGAAVVEWPASVAFVGARPGRLSPLL